jgi:hypothetical protein
MAQCKTIQLLEGLATGHGDWSPVASSCLDLVQNMRECGLNAQAIEYLQMFVEEIYKAGEISLLDHLRDGAADCAMCQEIARHMTHVSG